MGKRVIAIKINHIIIAKNKSYGGFMKHLVQLIVVLLFFAGSINAQTSNRYLETFESGNGAGWAFLTSANCFIQNGNLNVVYSSDDLEIVTLYPPVGATVNDFSLELFVDPLSQADGGFIGRLGFNSAIGMQFIENEMRLVYSSNIGNFMNPNFTTLYSGISTGISAKVKMTVQKAANDLVVSIYFDDVHQYTGTIVNAHPSLFSGNILIEVVGEDINFRISQVDLHYNPYIPHTSNYFEESFSTESTPWIKFGNFDLIGTGITISNGKLNINTGTSNSYKSMYVASPIGAVTDFEMSATGSGDLNDGRFGMYRIGCYTFYMGYYIEDDFIKLCYGVDPNSPPIDIAQAPFTPPAPGGSLALKLKIQNTGNNMSLSAFVENVLAVSGNVSLENTRYHTGHLVFGVDADDQGFANMEFDNVVISYNKFVTSIDDETIPAAYFLSQNYPNPFNPVTKINYSITKSERVKLSVYDILGNEITILVNNTLEPGVYEASFDGSNLTSGVYIIRIQSDSFNESKKMVLMK